MLVADINEDLNVLTKGISGETRNPSPFELKRGSSYCNHKPRMRNIRQYIRHQTACDF